MGEYTTLIDIRADRRDTAAHLMHENHPPTKSVAVRYEFYFEGLRLTTNDAQQQPRHRILPPTVPRPLNGF